MSVELTQSNNYTNQGFGTSLKNLFTVEGEILLNATKKCEELWEEMRRADFRKEGVINEKNIQLVYERKKNLFQDLLKIESAEEFLEIFDDDEDGFLNEDEQILVFTLIKERIQVIAEELCFLKKYELYKDLMREVRGIESLINKYQNELRANVHKRQLDDYVAIGYEMQDEFNGNWENKFKTFDKKSNEEFKDLDVQLKRINDLIYQKESNKIHSLKLKPSNKIRLLQNQEKLVAINERVEEAANFRNELKILEKKERDNLKKKKNEMIKNLSNKLDKEEKMELKKKEDRINLEKNKLLIDKFKQTDLLNKQINLHINDITRIQNALSNMYLEKGKKNDELKRMKERQRQTNVAISKIKSIKNNYVENISYKHDLALALLNLPSKGITLNNSMETTGMSKMANMKKVTIALKFMINHSNLTRFDINNEFNSRKFCNYEDGYQIKNDNNYKKKIRKLLDQRKHKDEIMISPTDYYDSNLNLVVEAKDFRTLLPKLS